MIAYLFPLIKQFRNLNVVKHCPKLKYDSQDPTGKRKIETRLRKCI